MVLLTSNNTRELSEALKRRCLYLFVDYPTQDDELEIVRLKVPDLGPELAQQAVAVVHQLRNMDLRKVPSISETLDWARALVTLNAKSIDEQTMTNTLTVLLKYEADVAKARRMMGDGGSSRGSSGSGGGRRGRNY
jgi:MoxR-like ATPase